MDPRLVEVFELKATVAQRSHELVDCAGRSVPPIPIEGADQKLAPLRCCVPSFAQEHSAHDTDAAMMEDERGDANGQHRALLVHGASVARVRPDA